jgi:hypothetical protein
MAHHRGEIEMPKYAKRIGCTIVGMTLALLGTPVAQADNASFVAAARALGFLQSPDNLIRSGRSACYFLIRENPEEVADHIKRYASVAFGQANDFLVLSVNEYCPQYSGRVGA